MSVLDLIGLQRIFHDGKEMFRRKNLNFIGGTVTDNPKTDSTDISIGEGGGGGGGAVSSVFGRTGAVVAALGDYTSSLINNASVVTGTTVTIALNSLNAAISSLNTALGGKVSGPVSANDGIVSLFSGTTGKVIKTSLVSIDGLGNITTPGLVDGRDVSVDGAKLDGIPAGGGGGGGPAAPTAAPPAVGASSAIGTAGKYATEDHTHGHGDLAGGTLHAPVAAGGAAGFMSGADKSKLDGIPSGGGGPVAPGAAPPDVAAAGATGTPGTYATATHTHGHGAQAGGALHAPVVAGGAAGFMTGADKTKLDGIPAGGGGGAPVGAQYITFALDGTLTNERAIAAGNGVAFADGGVGGNLTLSADRFPINDQLGTSYTLALADAGRLIVCDNAAAINVNIPANATVPYPVGTVIGILQKSTGQITVNITTDSLLNPGLTNKTRTRWSRITIEKINATTWVISGDLAVA